MRQSVRTAAALLALAVAATAVAASAKAQAPAQPAQPITAPATAPQSPAAPAAPTPAVKAVSANGAPTSCIDEIAKAEKRHAIPPGLLLAIGLVESGRRDSETGMTAPWPWSINAFGDGHFFDTEEQGVRAVTTLLNRNVARVDVGCMQVDLFHHPHAFRTLAAAFDPETNVDYAAGFLRDLELKHGSWPAAAAAYHAGDPALGGEYVARVFYVWKTLGLRPEMAKVGAGHASGRRGFQIDAHPRPLDVAAAFVGGRECTPAELIYRAVLRANPDEPVALQGMGECLRQHGRDDEARLYFERTLTVSPNNRAALESLLAIIDRQPPARRLTSLLSAREVAPAAPGIPARLALLEAERGDLAAAVRHMAEAVRLAPGDAARLLDYAVLLDRKGERATAAAAYRRFLDAYSPDVVLTVSLDSVRRRMRYLESVSP